MIFFVFTGTLILQRCKQKESETVSLANSKNGFVSDKSCKSCHAKEYNDWLQSHHFMAMQPPNDSTVEGNFNNATFTADGVNSRFFKKYGKFFNNTKGDD